MRTFLRIQSSSQVWERGKEKGINAGIYSACISFSEEEEIEYYQWEMFQNVLRENVNAPPHYLVSSMHFFAFEQEKFFDLLELVSFFRMLEKLCELNKVQVLEVETEEYHVVDSAQVTIPCYADFVIRDRTEEFKDTKKWRSE